MTKDEDIEAGVASTLARLGQPSVVVVAVVVVSTEERS